MTSGFYVLRDFGNEALDSFFGVGTEMVHFPVAGNDGFTHNEFPPLKVNDFIYRSGIRHPGAVCLRGIPGKRRRPWRCG